MLSDGSSLLLENVLVADLVQDDSYFSLIDIQTGAGQRPSVPRFFSFCSI